MKFTRSRMNLLLLSFVIYIGGIILIVDADTLNSFFVNYHNDDLVIKEVSVKKDLVEEDNHNNNLMVLNKVENNNLSHVAYNDYWAWPTDANYIVTSFFGYRWGSMHNAIDISGTGYGSNIYAANNGVVTLVRGGCVAGNTSCNGRGGNYIIINHNSNNYYTIYMHLKDIYVSEGQVVSRGQIIGSMGNTGNVVPVPTSSAPYLGTHLHFGIYIGEPYKGGYAIDPMRLY